MAKYINKSELVSEIERKRDICMKVILDLRSQENKDYYNGKAEAYGDALSVIDTFKVKDFDLKKEYDNEFFKDPVFNQLVNRNAGISIAKYFFELGLKAQK